jgi:hypothetical protein
MREVLRSVSDLYFSRHCLEQKLFWASLYRIKPKRPLHWQRRFMPTFLDAAQHITKTAKK